MVNSDVSGVMFSIDPVTNDKDRIIIEAVWGLGEMIVQGSVVPDTYTVQKDTFQILSKEISDQHLELVRYKNKTVEKEVPKKIKDIQKISNEEIITFARLSQKLQDHYYHPQDTEWAKEGKNLYIVQTRPVTTTGEVNKKIKESGGIKTSEIPVLKGVPASPGTAIGVVKILKSPKEISKINRGDILVAPMTSPDYVPAMKKAGAIITDEGANKPAAPCHELGALHSRYVRSNQNSRMA
jgi:pyruvate,water dikinase